MNDGLLKIGTSRLPSGAELLRGSRGVEAVWVCSKDGDKMPDDLAVALGEAPEMEGVRALKIEKVDLGSTALGSIAGSTVLAGLESLALWDCDWASKLGSEIAERVGGSKGLAALKDLEITDTIVTSEGVRAIAQLPLLETLLLHGCSIGDEGAEALLSSGLLARLKGVVLGDATVSDVVWERVCGDMETVFAVRQERPWLKRMGGS